jgi:hypothetical protein
MGGLYSCPAFKSLSIIYRCPVNMKIPAPKIRTLQIGSKRENDDFLENGYNDFN